MFPFVLESDAASLDLGPMDIEDLVKYGEESQKCPFYLTRQAQAWKEHATCWKYLQQHCVCSRLQS